MRQYGVQSLCHLTGRLSASARRPASVITTQTTVIPRAPVRIVPGWIAAMELTFKC
jgi:hypothetical protein